MEGTEASKPSATLEIVIMEKPADNTNSDISHQDKEKAESFEKW